MNEALIVAAQTVVVAIIMFAGQWVIARLSKQAQEAPVEVDQQSKATEAWQAYAQEMKENARETLSRLGQVEDRLTEAEKRESENRSRIAALERQGERDKDLIRRLVYRLRKALEEITRLGGTVPDTDSDIADLAQLRLDMAEARGEGRHHQ